MSWLDRAAAKFGPDWHSSETTWPSGEKTKEHFESKGEADQVTNNPLFDSDFEHKTLKEDGPSADPDANQAHSWLGRWQAERAEDPDWKMPSEQEEEYDRTQREAETENARMDSGYYDGQHKEDEDRRQAITELWDTEGYQNDVDYKAEYEQSLNPEDK